MKSLCLSLFLLALVSSPVFAAPATPSATATPSGTVQGTEDDPFASEYSDASLSATPLPTPRAITYSTAQTPVSGAVENTLILLFGGSALILLGVKFSRF